MKTTRTIDGKSEIWKILMKYGQARQKAQPSSVAVIRETRKAEAKIQALINNQVIEADIKARIDEWENIDGDDAHYWDYREVGKTTEKVYLTPIERNDELEAKLKDTLKDKGGE